MDMVEDLAEEEDSALEEALPPGPMLAWDEEGCLDVAISSVWSCGNVYPAGLSLLW